MLEVVGDKLERVAEGGDGREANLLVGLLLAGALDDGGEDGVGVGGEGGTEAGILSLADVTNRGERGLLLVVGTFGNILDQEGQ